jgi:sirohydrochlorin ferrochelatase
MRRELGTETTIGAVCMEKREECEFNGPLLEEALDTLTGDVIVALLFLQPGRHAGPGGDIENIIANAMHRNPHLRCHRTPLLAQNSLIIDILRDRYIQASSKAAG